MRPTSGATTRGVAPSPNEAMSPDGTTAQWCQRLPPARRGARAVSSTAPTSSPWPLPREIVDVARYATGEAAAAPFGAVAG